MIDGQEFVVIDIGTRSRNAAVAQRIDQRGFHHDRPARRVDQDRIRLHQAKFARSDETAAALASASVRMSPTMPLHGLKHREHGDGDCRAPFAAAQ
jgi:hypothetical protein